MNIFNYHKEQERPGWCGVAVIQMALLAGDINISQEEIADHVFKDWWGTPSELIIAYLSKYFKIVNYKINSSIGDISYHLKKDHIIIARWWDDIDSNDYDNGHYSIITEHNKKEKMITLADPSKGRGVWKIPTQDFKRKWFDTLDTNKKTFVDGLMIWINLNSKIRE